MNTSCYNILVLTFKKKYKFGLIILDSNVFGKLLHQVIRTDEGNVLFGYRYNILNVKNCAHVCFFIKLAKKCGNLKIRCNFLSVTYDTLLIDSPSINKFQSLVGWC